MRLLLNLKFHDPRSRGSCIMTWPDVVKVNYSLKKSISLPLGIYLTNLVQFEQENIYLDVFKPPSRVEMDSGDGC